jgi:hypothetical protein
VCTGYDVQNAVPVNLTGKTFEQAIALLFTEAGRTVYVEEEFHPCLTAIDVLASRASAARESEL